MTPLSDKLTDSSSATLGRAVIVGKTTAGGGGYVAVKVNPSGALTVDATATDLDIRNLTFAQDKVDATGSSVTVGNTVSVVDAVADANFDAVRVRRGDVLETEDALYDIPTSLIDSFIYVGVAPAGTLTSAASWKIRRVTFNGNGLPIKDQFRTGVVWNNRTTGWS